MSDMTDLAVAHTVTRLGASETTLGVSGSTHHPTSTATPLVPTTATKKKVYDKRFLPGTVLKKGAIGPVVGILREKLKELYNEGFIKTNPNDYSAPSGYVGDGSGLGGFKNALEEYVNNGISYKTKLPSSFLLLRSFFKNYNIDKWIWDSLDLPLATALEDMFHITSNSGTNTINLKLSGNDITIEYRPSFCVERNNITSYTDPYNGTYTISTLDYIDPIVETTLYEDYVLKGLQGVAHWLNETPQIQGVTPKINIIIYDVGGKKLDLTYGSTSITSASLSGLDFLAKNKKDATIYIEEKTLGIMATMVADAATWKKNKKLQIHVRNTSVGASSYWYGFDTLIEHEFGHVLGIFDAYGYKEHFWTGGVWLPEADIDGVHVTLKSPMLCKYETKHRPWERTETDWEMVLFAWQQNKLQCYINSVLGQKSQAYYH